MTCASSAIYSTVLPLSRTTQSNHSAMPNTTPASACPRLVCAAKSTSIINSASRLTARHGISVVIRAESFTTSPPQQSRPVINAETTLEKRRLYSGSGADRRHRQKENARQLIPDQRMPRRPVKPRDAIHARQNRRAVPKHRQSGRPALWPSSARKLRVLGCSIALSCVCSFSLPSAMAIPSDISAADSSLPVG